MSDLRFDFDEINASGACRRYMEERLHAKAIPGTTNRYPCPFRADADSDAFAVDETQWYDHVDGEGGNLLQLCAKAEFGGDLDKAQRFLGQWLGLEPTKGRYRPGKKQARKPARPVSRKAPEKNTEPEKPKRPKARACDANLVATYDYLDLDGTLLYQVCRYEQTDAEKTFRQRRPAENGGWDWSIKGTKLALYRWPEWAETDDVIYLCEGEKDAENLASIGLRGATTMAMGAGKWNDAYTEALRGRDVVILPDNDEVGQKHARRVAEELVTVVHRVRILTLSDAPKGDVSDWLEHARADYELGVSDSSPQRALHHLVQSAPIYHPPRVTRAEIEAAKAANAEPLRNYTVETVTGDDGKDKQVREPRTIRDLLDEIDTRFHGWPRRVGSTLFDHDHDTEQIRTLTNDRELCAWIAEKSNHPLLWGRVEGTVSKAELYASIYANAQQYERIAATPTWPRRADIYYMHDELPTADPSATSLHEFAEFFSPATELDRWLIKLLVVSGLYYRREAKRPLWCVDSTSGQGAGKTTLIEMVCRLIGGSEDGRSPIMAQHRAMGQSDYADRLTKRILSSSGRRKNFLLFDNIDGRFSCPELAALVTQDRISGMAPYGRGEESRENDLTYCLTGNTISLDRDLITRAVMLHLGQSKKDPTWARRLSTWIEANRQQVIADCIGLMDRPVTFDFQPATRVEVWEAEVAIQTVRDLDLWSEIWKQNEQRKQQADSEAEEAESIRDRIIEVIQAQGAASGESGYLTWGALQAIAMHEMSLWRGRPGICRQQLSGFAKSGQIPELSMEPNRVQYGGRRVRGMAWNHDDQVSPRFLVDEKAAERALEKLHGTL